MTIGMPEQSASTKRMRLQFYMEAVGPRSHCFSHPKHSRANILSSKAKFSTTSFTGQAMLAIQDQGTIPCSEIQQARSTSPDRCPGPEKPAAPKEKGAPDARSAMRTSQYRPGALAIVQPRGKPHHDRHYPSARAQTRKGQCYVHRRSATRGIHQIRSVAKFAIYSSTGKGVCMIHTTPPYLNAS